MAACTGQALENATCARGRVAGDVSDCAFPQHAITIERAPGGRNYDFYLACSCRETER